MSIKLEHINYIYGNDTANPVHATNDVSLEIKDGEFVGLMGHTGSGKSTLIQHFNGLIRPTSGNIYYNGKNISDEDFSMKQLRQKVGLVFQYPEHQLFEVTVFDDVCFGPKNLGLSKEEIKEKAKQALALVGLDESYYERSPFELSGGQKRRVAIAGVLAMEPEILILDEPTAGLDPKERVKFRNLISSFSQDKIVILSTHIISDIECIADKIILMKNGKKILEGTQGQLLNDFKNKIWKSNVEPNLEELYLAYFQDSEENERR